MINVSDMAFFSSNSQTSSTTIIRRLQGGEDEVMVSVSDVASFSYRQKGDEVDKEESVRPNSSKWMSWDENKRADNDNT